MENNKLDFFAFWDKSKAQETLVVVSQGFFKKSGKIPSKEINKALQMRANYFENL